MGVCPCSRDPAVVGRKSTTVAVLRAADAQHFTRRESTLRVSLTGDHSVVFLGDPFTTDYRHLDEISYDKDVRETFAEYIATRQRCYVKIISKGLKGYRAHGKRTPVESLPKLDHPHILKTYEICQDDKFKYVIAEAYSGDISDYLPKYAGLEQSLAATVVQQVLSALAYCHSLGFAHKSLSLERILMKDKLKADSVTVKLAGFENFGLIPAGKESQSALFQSPEVRAGREVTEKADVWSCGVLLYYLLSGEPPFKSLASTLPSPLSSANVSLRASPRASPQTSPFASPQPSPLASPDSSPRPGRPDSTMLFNPLPDEYKLSFPPEKWKGVGKGAMALIAKMLCRKPASRPSAAQCLRHPWLRRIRSHLTPFSAPVLSALKALRDKGCGHPAREAVLLFILYRVLKPEVLSQLVQVFDAFDRDHDGQISNEELAAAVKDSNMLRDLNKITAKAAHSPLKFTDFAAAAVDDNLVFAPEHTLLAFSTVDTERSGRVFAQDLKYLFQVSGACSSSRLQAPEGLPGTGEDLLDLRAFRALIARKP